MKIETLSTLFMTACLGATAWAQTPTVVNGHKVLIDRNGRVVAAPTPTTPPPAPLVGGAAATSDDTASGSARRRGRRLHDAGCDRRSGIVRVRQHRRYDRRGRPDGS